MTPTKMRKATATQNSASMLMVSPLDHGVDGGLDRLAGGLRADQSLDDRGGGLDRDPAHVLERRLLGRHDRSLGLVEPGVELMLESLAGLVGFGVELLARLAGDR